MKSGENMLALVRATQRLHQEIAALLKTFEKLVGEHGFVNAKDRGVSNACSYSIDTPEEWMMPWMFRHMRNRKDADDYLTLNIALTPRRADDRTDVDFTEPLAFCSRIGFAKGKGSAHSNEWDPWKLWFFGPRMELGRVYGRDEVKIDDKVFLQKAEWDIEDVRSIRTLSFFAVPLASLEDSKILDKEIVRRALDH